MKCPKCERDDFFSVSRTRTIVQFRNIDTSGKKETGYTKYKGNWRQEKEYQDKKMFIRCNACESVLTSKEIEGVSEIKIDKSKGVLFISDGLEKFM